MTRLTRQIIAGMVLGIAAGFVLNRIYAPSDPTHADPALAAWADYLRLLPDVFLRLIKMIIAPLVFATIVTGIAGMGAHGDAGHGDGGHGGDSHSGTGALGRIGAKALAWFVCASLVSLSLGMLLVNLLQPGRTLSLKAAAPIGALDTADLSLRHFVLEIFPTSAIDAMATNNILQILVFSVFVGVALIAIGDAGRPIARAAEALASLMLRITDIVMRFAPLAVFGALAAVVAVQGLGVIRSYGVLVAEFYGALLLLWFVLIAVGALFLGPRIVALLRLIREPLLLSFSTASSEAGLPRLFEQLDRFGVPRRISGFILPLGYSFNLDGSMMYMSFASLFIAQAYGIAVPLGTQALMLLTLMVSSKGIAGVPRASLVVIAATLTRFGLPIEGIALLLGVDTFLDMGRSATNLVGNAVATAVITKSEGLLADTVRDNVPGIDKSKPDGQCLVS